MKCFFFLRDGAGCFAGSLGVLCCDLDAVADHAAAIAQALPSGRAMFVIASDQRGHELARAPIEPPVETAQNHRLAAASSDTPSIRT
jgi:hypothetical protein